MRINIGLLPSAELSQLIVQANATINAGADGDIEFGPSEAIPHITLLMGHLNHESDLGVLISTVKTVVSEITDPLQFALSDPYFSAQSSGFVFVDVEPATDIVGWRYRIERSLNGLLTLEPHGGVTNPPHITLGYVTRARSNDLLDQIRYFHGRRDMARAVRISHVGSRGTARSAIAEFSLRPLTS